MRIYDSALGGLQQAELHFAAAASNIACASAPQAKALRANDDRLEATDQPAELAADMVELSTAKAQFRANVAVIKTADEVTKGALDLLA